MQREQPFEVQLPQCATEHARHAEDNVTRMLQSSWPDDLEGKFNSFHIRSAYVTGVYWASFVKAKTLQKMCFESSSVIANVAAATVTFGILRTDGILRTELPHHIEHLSI